MVCTVDPFLVGKFSEGVSRLNAVISGLLLMVGSTMTEGEIAEWFKALCSRSITRGHVQFVPL